MSYPHNLPGKKDIDEAELRPDLIKVTVLLPEDTINKLDSMAKVALLGSRGRTIQALVDSVWDSKNDISNIMMNLKSFQNNPIKTEADTGVVVMFVLFNLANVMGRLNKFLGLS